MTKPPPTAAPAPRAETARAARLEREAAALRENLRRRKQQARARTGPDTPNPGKVPHDADEG